MTAETVRDWEPKVRHLQLLLKEVVEASEALLFSGYIVGINDECLELKQRAREANMKAQKALS